MVLDLLCGGSDAPSLGVSKVDGANLDNGYFVKPTILTEVGHNSAAWKEEIFGPVLCISTFTTEEEAVRLTNDSPYGLGHAVMSADIDRCERVADGLHAGTVWINSNQALDSSREAAHAVWRMEGEWVWRRVGCGGGVTQATTPAA